jgi:hypothetical protein
VVVEGAARAVGAKDAPPGVSVAVATGSGDDEVVAAVQRAVGDGGAPLRRRRVDVLVVTADRGLRDRVTPLGAVCVGPRWLTDRW